MPLSEKQLVVAYALSKQTLADEMADFDRYNQMPFTEFYEFIGRCAAQAYVENAPLAKKIERILTYLLPLVKAEYIAPGQDEHVESDSDYEEDWLDEIIQTELSRREATASGNVLISTK